jgi:CheY-like chemotaxis protein
MSLGEIADCRLQVLIVDDDSGSASSMAELVKLLGHDAFVANGGARALEIAQVTPIDVALLDIEMPGMDGHEVARRLVLLRRQAVYIVAVTGRGSEADMVRSVTAGFIEHVVKPCTMKHLSKVLVRASDHLQRKRRAIESPQ